MSREMGAESDSRTVTPKVNPSETRRIGHLSVRYSQGPSNTRQRRQTGTNAAVSEHVR